MILHCDIICPSAVQQGLLHLKEHAVILVPGFEEITSDKAGPTSFLDSSLPSATENLIIQVLQIP